MVEAPRILQPLLGVHEQRAPPDTPVATLNGAPAAAAQAHAWPGQPLRLSLLPGQVQHWTTAQALQGALASGSRCVDCMLQRMHVLAHSADSQQENCAAQPARAAPPLSHSGAAGARAPAVHAAEGDTQRSAISRSVHACVARKLLTVFEDTVAEFHAFLGVRCAPQHLHQKLCRGAQPLRCFYQAPVAHHFCVTTQQHWSSVCMLSLCTVR